MEEGLREEVIFDVTKQPSIIQGKPAALEDKTNPDWLPNQNLGYISTVQPSQSACSRFEKDFKGVKIERGAQADAAENPIQESNEPQQEEISAEQIQENCVSAKKDLLKLDVLVCGECHKVFHFVEELVEHKQDKCSKLSDLAKTCKNEGNAQVWAFTLWKQKQMTIKNEGGSSAWAIYQRWCNLSPSDKEPWTIAGDTIQWQNKLGSAKVVEVNAQSSHLRDPSFLDNIDASKLTSATVTSSTKKEDLSLLGAKNEKSALRVSKATTEEFVAERILAKRFASGRRTWEYKIKWENCPEEESTWEPLAHLASCKSMIDEFDEKLRRLKLGEAAKEPAVKPSLRGHETPRLTASPVPSNMFISSIDQGFGSGAHRTSNQKVLNQVKEWCINISDDEESSSKRPYEYDFSDDLFKKRKKLEAESQDRDLVELLKKAYKKPGRAIVNGPNIASNVSDNVLIPDSKEVVRIKEKQLPSLSSGVYIRPKTSGIIKLGSETSKIATSGGQATVNVAQKIGQTNIKSVKKDGVTTNKIIPVSPTKMRADLKASVAKIIKAFKSNRILKPKKLMTEKPKLAKPETKEEIESYLDYGLEELEFSTDLPLSEAESQPLTDKFARIEYLEPKPESKPHPRPEPGVKLDGEPAPPVKSVADTESDQHQEELAKSKMETEANTNIYKSLTDNLVKQVAVDITEDDLQPISAPSSADSTNVDNSLLDNLVKEAAAHITEDDLQPLPVTSSAVIESDVGDIAMDTSESVYTAVETKVEDAEQVVSESTVVAAPVVAGSKIVTKITPKETVSGINILQQTLQTSTPAPCPKIHHRILSQNVAPKPIQYSPTVTNLPHARNIVATPRPKVPISFQSQRFSSSPRGHPFARGTIARRIGSTTIYKNIATGSVSENPPKAAANEVSIYPSSPQVFGTVAYKTPTGTFKTANSSKSSPILKPSPIYKKKETSLLKCARSPVVKPKPIISMPSLSVDIEQVPAQEVVAVTPAASVVANGSSNGKRPETDGPTFSLTNNGTPIFLTGDDGTVFQVVGQDEQGQTILITHGADGRQQCLLVTTEFSLEELTQAAPETPASVSTVATAAAPVPAPVDINEPLSITTDDAVPSDQVVVQVVRTEPPSPGGTHNIVVRLPDGSLMLTQLTPEEYVSLGLDK